MNVLWHMFITFCVALLPILEIRGAIPYGFAFGLEWWQTYIVGVIGNLLPVPFIILFIRKIFFWLKDKNRYVGAIYRLEKKAQAKAAKIQNYQLIGLLSFGRALPHRRVDSSLMRQFLISGLKSVSRIRCGVNHRGLIVQL